MKTNNPLVTSQTLSAEDVTFAKAAERFLRLPDVMDMTGKLRTSIYEDIKNKMFPSPIPIGKRAVAWRESEVHEWMKACIQSRKN